ncbi:c-type cytochrome [Sulfurimonas lithotrophica]|uniref:C-type cytochrome n=1 Tax=Sulfurimonas lithotrophica TaxID=2590022 RepID=A0A5P8P0G5_9BACT|nr:c-type cytochrome [Sulfurimonas lithotrophica]QFR49101.1 c-type cytochrome [Sulfurimonas lithotrophica]
MKKIIGMVILFLLLASQAQAISEGENLANEKCGSCHLMGQITKEKLNRMAAPPYWILGKKVKAVSKNEEEAVNFIVDYVYNPSEDKMLFPKETKERFGLMPSLKGIVTEDELRSIAKYILDNASK